MIGGHGDRRGDGLEAGLPGDDPVEPRGHRGGHELRPSALGIDGPGGGKGDVAGLASQRELDGPSIGATVTGRTADAPCAGDEQRVGDVDRGCRGSGGDRGDDGGGGSAGRARRSHGVGTARRDPARIVDEPRLGEVAGDGDIAPGHLPGLRDRRDGPDLHRIGAGGPGEFERMAVSSGDHDGSDA